MIEIDGSYGEGGGAILRQAIGMAAYAGRPVRISNIRAGRKHPGLAPQHLKAVEAVAGVCGARVRGAALGSLELSFEPGPVRSAAQRLEIGTAGSMGLLLQAVLLPCFCSAYEFEFEFGGGSDVPWSPPVDYLRQVTLPTLAVYGRAELELVRRGYYPKGGGRLKARLYGGAAAGLPLELERVGTLRSIRGVSHAARQLRGRRVAERQGEAALEALTRLEAPAEIAVEYSDAANRGSGITLWAEVESGPALGGSALGARGVPAEEVGRKAARELLGAIESGGAVDRHLADQLVPFLAAAGGVLRAAQVTPHVRSNIYVAERVLGARFRVKGQLIEAGRGADASRA